MPGSHITTQDPLAMAIGAAALFLANLHACAAEFRRRGHSSNSHSIENWVQKPFLAQQRRKKCSENCYQGGKNFLPQQRCATRGGNFFLPSSNSDSFLAELFCSVHLMLMQCSRGVHAVFTHCSSTVHMVFTQCSSAVIVQFMLCSLFILWSCHYLMFMFSTIHLLFMQCSHAVHI